MDLDDLRAGFASPPAGAAPMMRWWWFGPDVEDAEVERELRAMADAGLGGAEIAFVYPLSAPEDADAPGGLFASERFLASLGHAVAYGHSLGLRMDLTLGSGWSFGGPHVTPDLASRGLAWERREITPGAHEIATDGSFPGDEFVAAFLGVGSSQEPPADCEPLAAEGSVLRVPDGRGPRQLLLAHSRLTGQNVKRAASGAEGPVLDHYSATAVRAHLAAVGDRLLDAVDDRLLGSVFCDSLEVYDANWTPDLPAAFEERRGYALLPRLHELVVDGPTAAALRADFHRTLTELYEERFVREVAVWASRRGVPFRLQGYGIPPASVGSYRGVDGIEGEGWGWRELTSAAWAASAAHELGTPVVSAEAWTWVHSPSFRATPLDLAGEAHEHLLAGVNQFVGHGWPYSPPDAEGVGWLFYASGALDDRNAWWPAAGALMAYLTRLSWLMRQGEPVADVTLLLPSEDVYAGLGAELDLYRATRRHIGDDVTAALRVGGWDYVLVDDSVVAAPQRRRPIVMVPRASRLAERTEAWLAERAASGSAVLRVADAGELTAALSAASPPDVVLAPNPGDVGVRHRRVGGADVYFVANTGPHVRRFTLTPRDARRAYERWDARTGQVGERLPGPGAPLVLHPYEATVLVGVEAARVPLTLGPWTIAGPGGGRREVGLPHCWEDDPALARHCGSVTYASTFELPAPGGRVVLDLGGCQPADAGDADEEGLRGHSFRAEVRTPVGEVAEVLVNGASVGVLWAPPYALDVTDATRPGPNELALVVSSTSAHALADDAGLPGRVAAITERFGRRFVMQDMALADAGVRSGLLGTPTLAWHPAD